MRLVERNTDSEPDDRRQQNQTAVAGTDDKTTEPDLFGLHEPPANQRPSYSRLARYDCTGLCWLLQSNVVIDLAKRTAAIRTGSGAVLFFHCHKRPAFGAPGDSLDDLS